MHRFASRPRKNQPTFSYMMKYPPRITSHWDGVALLVVGNTQNAAYQCRRHVVSTF